jgi:hypothetical protein
MFVLGVKARHLPDFSFSSSSSIIKVKYSSIENTGFHLNVLSQCNYYVAFMYVGENLYLVKFPNFAELTGL